MESRQPRTRNAILPVEWAAAILATGVALCLQFVFVTHAGGLWRDEINSLGTARAASASEFWRLEQFESFPALWLVLLKLWIAIGGDADAGLRAFGILGGASLVAALWFAAWRLRRAVPLLSVALLAINPEVLRWASTVRAWGLGAALAIVACALAAGATTTRKRSVGIASIAAIASVQCVYQNLVFVTAAAVALLVAGVGGSERTSRVVAAAVLVGAGALSLAPYWSVFQGRREWSMLIEGPLDLGEIGAHAEAVAGASGSIVEICWLASAASVVITALWRRKTLTVYSSVLLLVSILGITAFYFWFRISPSPWYFVGIFGIAAMTIDCSFGALFESRRSRLAISAAVLTILAAGLIPAQAQLAERQTNLDVIGEALSRQAAPGDLIVVSSWYMAITIDRYYHGAASLISVPPIADHLIHRYDLVKTAMQTSGVIDPVLFRVRETLQSGQQVWIVGDLGGSQDATPLPDLTAPPLPDTGWAAWPYTSRWASQVGWFIRRHATDARGVDVQETGGRFEAASLVVVRGWR